ncbi:membrane protein [Streptomyces phage Yosif]|uniref:Membrane protein n=1 Tax=Streptomyces phage Yosif TaxID=2201421 RepID=A0A2Z4QBT4_9CAUD|nr:membrane protein [Streptomyces phage Yosif]AWY07591.1 membrane protein [Streptomyces phage Yosif]
MSFLAAVEPSTQVAVITTGGTVVVALIGALVEFMRRQHNAINDIREHAAEARDQVANTHSTNLRDDLDDLHSDVRQVLDVLRQHGSEISGIRAEIRQEREERLAVSDRLDNHLASL